MNKNTEGSLTEKINKLRLELRERVGKNKVFSHNNIIETSQQLDKLIVSFMKEKVVN
jgi:hypothetical protein